MIYGSIDFHDLCVLFTCIIYWQYLWAILMGVIYL